MTLKEKEERLFREWRDDVQSRYLILIHDGVVNEHVWADPANRPKVLFVLKEINHKDGGADNTWSLSDYLADGAEVNTWANVARWVYGIKNMDDPQKSSWKEAVKRGNDCGRKKHLQSICAVNLKKAPGGATANAGKIRDFIDDNREYLRKQMELYIDQADIVVCCGKEVYNGFMSILPDMEAVKTEKAEYPRCRIVRRNGKEKIIIGHYHPQARISHEKMYDELLCMAGKLRLNK